MLPYFYKLDKRLISKETSDFLIKFVLENINKFIKNIPDSGFPEGNNHYFGKELLDIKEIQKLKNSCSINFYPVIYLQKPNDIVIPHIDNKKYRRSTLIHPLYPLENYSPTYFWGNDANPVAVCEFNDRLPAFLNVDKYHSLKNNNTYRFNLQFSFQENFDTVISLYQQNKLFQ